jgi:D-serine deaminase-like pyridoxal phosphate-dependent protein
MTQEWYQLSNECEVPSPSLLIFDENVGVNLRLMLEIAGGPARLRPHVKTHKLGALVSRQIALGITKFKCATIAEAEMCAAKGAADVMVAYPIVGPNIARFCALARHFPDAKFSCIADDGAAIAELNAASGEMLQSPLDVLLDLDCGMHRTGVAPGGHALELYKQIVGSPALHARGLHAYDGHINDPDPAVRREQCVAAFAPVVEFRKQLESAGWPVPLLVAGGSPTFRIHAEHEDRECSPGTTVLWDFGYGDKFADLPFDCAAVLLTRVVSKPGPNLLCLDLGHKAVAAENPHPRVRLLEIPGAEAVMHSEEHLVVETPRAKEFAVGAALHGIPRHVCPTVALHNEAYVVRGGAAAGRWPVTARGRIITY